MQDTNTSGIHRLYRRDNQPFAQIPNEAIRNPQNTANGFRLLAYLMSHRDGYELTYGQIERETGMGRYAINEAIKNLEALGWLKTERTKMPNGQYGPKSWTVLTPASASFSTVGDSTVEQPTDNKNNTSIEQQETRTILAQGELERLFQEFWKSYPRKVGKGAAWKVFKKLPVEVAELAALSAEFVANDPNLPPKQFIKHPATWLNSEGWTDEPYPERQLTPEEKEAFAKAEREARWAREKAEREERWVREQREREEREARMRENPVVRCEHGRVAVICSKCN